MNTVKGKSGTRATILADSISKAGHRFLSYEVEYPRIILAEANTHKMLSKSSFSSRAVPFKKMVEQLNGRPVRFGANQGGMQDQGFDYDAPVLIPEYLHEAFLALVKTGGNFVEITLDMLKNPEGDIVVTAHGAWELHRFISVGISGAFNDAKYHKQVVNRLTEAHQMMKTVISGTEWPNFFWLRDHGDADPTLEELARCMREAKDQSTPELLLPGEYHLPYVDYYREQIGYEADGDTPIYGPQVFYIGDLTGPDFEILKLDDAIKISTARCAAVSYRNEGYGLEKSLEVFDKLVGPERKHASAFEHQATPMAEMGIGWVDSDAVNVPFNPDTWEPGISHVDRDGTLWSGNLKGWIQHRKLIPGENYTG